MHKKLTIFLFLTTILVTSCGPGQLFGPTETPVPSETPIPTETFTAIPTEPPAPTMPLETEPAEVPTQAAPAQSALPVSGEPIFVEEFTDNSRGWASLDANAQVEVIDGNLLLSAVKVDPPAIAYCTGQDCIPPGDRFYYQVVLAEEIPAEQGIGLVFGLDPAKETYYRLSIRPSDGKYSLRKRIAGEWDTPAHWEDSEYINLTPAINTIGVGYQGGIVDIYINGQRIANRVDTNPLPAGAIGLIAEGGALMVNSAALLNLEIAQPPSETETLRPTNTPGNTPTPSPYAACYPGVPEGHWVLQITLVGNEPMTITIDGVNYELKDMISVFYLTIGDVHVVKIGNKTREYQMKECKVEYVKAKK
jgi:hypothetical protein